MLKYPDVEFNHGNLRELAVAAYRFDIVAGADTKVTQRQHVAELRLPGFSAPILLLRGSRPDGLGLALYIHTDLAVSRQSRYECDRCEVMVAKVVGRRMNFYLFIVYCSPATNDRGL